MNDFADKTALIVDHGIYPHLAIKLAESFGRVLYFVPWITSAFPSSTLRNVGCGLPGVERVFSWLAVMDEADLVVCPDVYSWDIVAHCRKLGKPTWGASYSEALELERWKTKEHLLELEMPVVPGLMIEGVEALRTHLENPENEDRYIKTSVTRGDFETFHHVNWHTTKPWLDELTHRLGPRQAHIEFIVERPIAGVEIGYDGFSVDGQYPHTASWGIEIKDAGYVGKVAAGDEFPEVIRYCNDSIASTLKQLECRGFFSNEIRVGEDRTPYLIDPTMRMGSPPSESYIELFDNWADVIWAGAHGEVIDLNPIAKYSAQIVLKSDWVADEKFLAVSYPPELAPFVKLHNCCVIDGQTYVAPQEFPEFGSVIGLGNSLQEAMEHAKDRADEIECLDLRWSEDVFDKAQRQIDGARKAGVNF